jgi:hypothetical protein
MLQDMIHHTSIYCWGFAESKGRHHKLVTTVSTIEACHLFITMFNVTYVGLILEIYFVEDFCTLYLVLELLMIATE